VAFDGNQSENTGILHRDGGLAWFSPLLFLNRRTCSKICLPLRSAGVLPRSIPTIHASSSGSVDNIMIIHINHHHCHCHYYDHCEFNDKNIMIIVNLMIRNDHNNYS
jgi:hypothetical protein